MQVKRLLSNKPPGLFEDYRRGVFEELLAERSRIHEHKRLPGGTRTLYLAEAKP